MIKKIIEYLPYHQQKIIDYQEICNATESYCDNKIYNQLNKINNNRSIFTADEDKIKEWEKILDISSLGTLEERRQNVFIAIITKVPFTEQWLRQWLNTITNNNKVIMNYNEYKCVIKISNEDTNKLPTIRKMLDMIMPAHIDWIVVREDVENITQEVNNYIYMKMRIKEHIGYGEI